MRSIPRHPIELEHKLFVLVSKCPTSLALCGIILYGAFLRVLYVIKDPVISRDGLLYLNQYNHWLMPVDVTPVSPVLGYLFHLGDVLLQDPVMFVRFFNISAGTLLIWIVYDIAVCTWKHPFPGLIAALLIAVNYTLIRTCGELQRESGYLLGWGVSLSCICHSCFSKTDKEKIWSYLRWIGGGFFAAWAFLFRYEGGEILLLATGILLFGVIRNRFSWQEALKLFAIFFVVWLSSIFVFYWGTGLDWRAQMTQIYGKLTFYSDRIVR